MADKRSGANNNEEKELAQVARKEFEAKNFSACMDKLKSLNSLSANNPKIQHNMCVCHFHQSGFQHVENLKKGLRQVCNQVSGSAYYSLKGRWPESQRSNSKGLFLWWEASPCEVLRPTRERLRNICAY